MMYTGCRMRHERAHRQPEQTPPYGELPAVAAALDSSGEVQTDLLHGEGLRFRLEHETVLELFPNAHPDGGVVRLSGAAFHLELVRQPPATIGNDGLIVEQSTPAAGWQRLTVTAAGAVTFVSGPGRPPEPATMPQEDPIPSDEPITALADETLASDNPGADPTVSTEPSSPAKPDSQPRVACGGRLGNDPRVKETKTGQLVAEFEIAVKEAPDDAPRWVKCVAFGARAARIRDGLRKGQFVDVIGYEHAKTRTGRDGHPRTEVQLYVAVVKPR